MKIYSILFATIFSILTLNISYAEENWPLYDNFVLTIPFVDTLKTSGEYQDAKFEYTEQNGWQLLDYKNSKLLNSITDEIALGIEKVEMIKIDTFPIQVFLKVTGILFSECGELGLIRNKLSGRKFTVFIYDRNDAFTCISSGGTTSFSKIIPLDVYSLDAGEYEYNVNSNFSGVFSLSKDNRLE
jgi:hypothetical protein